MQGRTDRLLWLAIAITIVAGDRLTKSAVQHHLSPYSSISLIPGWLRFIHAENPGAAFGFFADGNPLLRSLVLIGVSAGVLIYVASLLWIRTQPLLMGIGLSLVLGGACGNLYDRILHQKVTDFIEVYHGNWSFPAFNVADSAITVGAALLLIELLFSGRNSTSETHVSQAH